MRRISMSKGIGKRGGRVNSRGRAQARGQDNEDVY